MKTRYLLAAGGMALVKRAYAYGIAGDHMFASSPCKPIAEWF